MIDAYVPPVIEEDDPVFIRHAGEVRHDYVRKALVALLAFRLDNDLNHIQFMGGYGKANYAAPEYPEENRALLIEWEKQTRRLKEVARQLSELGAPVQQMVAEANYWLERGTYKQPLFATELGSWNEMLVWRWLRARAHCARAILEFGSIYVPLSDIAFQTYFDLGLTRWPAASTGAPVERLTNALRGGGRDEIAEATRRWYPIAERFVGHRVDESMDFLGMRLWTRDPALALATFRDGIARDLSALGLRADLIH